MFVKEIIKHSVAAEQGGLKVGDTILKVSEEKFLKESSIAQHSKATYVDLFTYTRNIKLLYGL